MAEVKVPLLGYPPAPDSYGATQNRRCATRCEYEPRRLPTTTTHCSSKTNGIGRERKREKKQCHKKRRLVLKQTRGERMSLRADEMDDEGHLYHQIRRCGHLLFDPPPKLNPPPPQTKNQFQHTGRLYSPTRKDSLDVSASRNRGASPTCNFFPLCVCVFCLMPSTRKHTNKKKRLKKKKTTLLSSSSKLFLARNHGLFGPSTTGHSFFFPSLFFMAAVLVT